MYPLFPFSQAVLLTTLPTLSYISKIIFRVEIKVNESTEYLQCNVLPNIFDLKSKFFFLKTGLHEQ